MCMFISVHFFKPFVFLNVSQTSKREPERRGPSKKIKREFMIPFHGAQECSLIIPPGFHATAQQVD